MIPVLLSPTILITPNSNVFDSTLIMSNAYTRRMLNMMKRSITMLKIKPRNNIAVDSYCIYERTSSSILIGKNPRASIISFAYPVTPL